ncbi:alginate lyase family protein [Stenotrophomonas sp. CFBP8980]|uniref:alginate lyase family protein n=1 Tax=Stenotrophomonas sp. CFBP8980 TaxID=3096523 RepID=UPI002A6A0D8B|nr:alginate lyase family protein [Stenotrophomonas sp. CFBP8980]MDY1034256.1 alginate lyase family protein [Stenotrophomonas sp. CFBP8980]
MTRLVLALIFIMMPLAATAADGHLSAHAFSSFEPSDLAWVKNQINSDRNSSERRALIELVAKADARLASKVTSVLDKRGIAPSGKKQDFYSIGAYSWPAPDGGDRAPYIRRDGFKNPEAYGSEYDKGRFNAMVNDVNTLSLAYYYTNDSKYAVKAGALLRSWFISPKTRMNPNFRHAAVQPGVNDGYYGGIIEGVVLIEMLDYVQLLEGSNALSTSEYSSLRTWFSQLSTWLVSSEFGLRERRSGNNHGSWYTAQVMAFSLYGGNRARAVSMLDLARRNLRDQFDSEGKLPREMKRSNSFMYAIYGLRSFIALARISEHLGHSLWQEGSDEGSPATLQKAFDYLTPFFSGARNWEGQMIDKDYDPYAIQIFRLGGAVYGTRSFNDVVTYLVQHRGSSDRIAHLLGRPSVKVKPASRLPPNPQTSILFPVRESAQRHCLAGRMCSPLARFMAGEPT